MGRNPMKPCCLLLVLTCSLVASRRGTFVSTRGTFAMSAGSNRAGNDEEELDQLDHAELIDELGDAGDTEFTAEMLSKLYATGGPISSWIYQRNASNQDSIDLCLNTTNDEDPCMSNVVMQDGAAEMVVKLDSNKWVEGSQVDGKPRISKSFHKTECAQTYASTGPEAKSPSF